MAASISFAFTLCRVANGGRIAAKRFVREADGSITRHDYDKVTLWGLHPVAETSLEGMADRLRALALDMACMIVMGVPAEGLDLFWAHRRWSAESRGSSATLRAVDRAWLPLDFDDVAVPAGLGRADRLSDAALYVRDHLLPEEFHGVRMVAVPSARTGMVGDSVARLRLFAALDCAHQLGALKDWAKGARAGLNLPLDPSVFGAGHPIYTARPKFTGIDDPVPRAVRAIVLPGRKDTVTLDVGRFDVKTEIVASNGKEKVSRNTKHLGKAPVVEGTVSCSAVSFGRDWWMQLEATVGGPDGFFEPLKKAIGTAVRLGARPEDIRAVIAALLARRADAHRLQAYGPEWVNRAIASFHRNDAARDAAARVAYARDLARLFQNGA
jgi:hypothetical protein